MIKIQIIRLQTLSTLQVNNFTKALLLLFCCLCAGIGYSQTNQASDFNTLQKNFLAKQKLNQKIYQDRLRADSIFNANVEKKKRDSLINTPSYNPLSTQSIQPQARLQTLSTQSPTLSIIGGENLGFENGLSNWSGELTYNLKKCGAGDSRLSKSGVDTSGDVVYPPRSLWDSNPFQLGNPLPLQSPRHAILQDKNFVDPYGGFQIFDPNIPQLGNSIARIGNGTIGSCGDGDRNGNKFLYEQESMSYTFLVGSNEKYLYINYAVVINEPTNGSHVGLDRTYFSMSVINNVGQEFACSKVDVYANNVNSNIPGFIRSSVEPWNTDPNEPDINKRRSVVYKPWSLALVDLSSFIGTTVTLNFATGDCLSGGHWAYAYVNAYTSTVGIKTVTDSGLSSEIFCQGSSVNFSSAYTGRFDDETYLWDFGDGTSGISNSLQAPSHRYSSAGEFTVTLRVTSRQIIGNCPISKKITITPLPSANVDFIAQTYLCATNFLPTYNFGGAICQPIAYFWTFGDGNTSTDKSPIHVYNGTGTYNVSLKLTYQCNDCQGMVTVPKQITFTPSPAQLEDKLIQVVTNVKKQVITSSAVTFSDVWSLSHDNAALGNRSSYLNGTQGVWRNNATYAYDVPRGLSATTNLAKDGTFTMNQFDWGSANFNIVPDWINANSMTQYSPYSYELENQDVLGVYSAALYDYGGHLPSANGVNMRNAEMAFTSFEFTDPNGKPSGNWMLSNIAQPATLVYKVPAAISYIATVEASLEELDLVTKVDVTANAGLSSVLLSSVGRLFNYLQDVDVLCKQAHPVNPKWSIIVLGRAPFEGLWFGQVTVKKTALPAVNPVLDNVVAHSGKSSLKITADKTFRQEMLQLEAGKTYWLNAWVSVNNPNVLTPKLADNLGIELTFKDKQGIVASSVLFQPVGTIIEGWQQVKGTFTCPIKNPIIELKFKPGSTGTAYYDDLRLQPEKGNMKAYVYDLNDYRLRAILDEENYASFFYYDAEGNLYLTKKETEKGIKTITENVSYQVER